MSDATDQVDKFITTIEMPLGLQWLWESNRIGLHLLLKSYNMIGNLEL
jgi:hypothetical protein